jgi:hypothetical protein
MKKSGSPKSKSPSQLIDARIKELGDWRGKMLSRLRTLVKEADPEVVEEWKWRGVPVWSHDGLICTGETYKNVVKMTFAKGAALKDPSRLFNSSLDGNTRRAIDFHESEKIDEEALKTLIRAAVTLNKSAAQSRAEGVRANASPLRSGRRDSSLPLQEAFLNQSLSHAATTCKQRLGPSSLAGRHAVALQPAISPRSG